MGRGERWGWEREGGGVRREGGWGEGGVSKVDETIFHTHYLKPNLNSGKKRKWILTESNETYTECSRLQINVMCQTILEENVYWLSNEHRKIRKSG